MRMQTAAGERTQADALANALIGEMLELSYMEPGQTSSSIGREAGESATSRAAYDDVMGDRGSLRRDRHAVASSASPSSARSCSRIRYFCTLPLMVRGKLSTKRT